MLPMQKPEVRPENRQPDLMDMYEVVQDCLRSKKDSQYFNTRYKGPRAALNGALDRELDLQIAALSALRSILLIIASDKERFRKLLLLAKQNPEQFRRIADQVRSAR